MVNLFIKGNQMKLEIKRIKSGFEDVPLPKYQTDGSVGMDICAAVDKPIVIEPKHACNVQTNVAIAVPKGYECQVRGRSGLAFKNNVFAFLGTIDSDYRGEIGVLLENRGIENFIVNRGDRIAQLIIAPIEKVNLAEVEELDVTERNTNGFGSTGK
jgi:dUTP pyrophosphatase